MYTFDICMHAYICIHMCTMSKIWHMTYEYIKSYDFISHMKSHITQVISLTMSKCLKSKCLKSECLTYDIWHIDTCGYLFPRVHAWCLYRCMHTYIYYYSCLHIQDFFLDMQAYVCIEKYVDVYTCTCAYTPVCVWVNVYLFKYTYLSCFDYSKKMYVYRYPWISWQQ